MKKVKILLTISLLALFSCSHEENENASNQVQMCAFNYINVKSASTAKSNLAIIKWPRWQTGQTIKIKFLDGDAVAQEKVKRIADEWTNYANLKFEYVSINEYADIRIGFNVGDYGAWSVLGMRSTYGNINEQSMRLGPLTAKDESSVRRTVLHEFGHALGLIHENASPVSKINWNLPKVYKYYSDLNGWSKEEVDQYVIKSPESTNYSEYDPLSIMHYYVDPSLTTDGVRVNEMTELSDIDKKYINEWYPFPIVSFVESGKSINTLPWKDRVKSPNGRYALEFVPGILRVNDLIEKKIIWEVGSSSYPVKSSCYFDSNGNITLKGTVSSIAPIKTLWNSNTTNYPGATLHLQNDGDLQLIYNENVKWSSKNGKL